MKVWKSVVSAALVSVLLVGCGSNAGTDNEQKEVAAGSTVNLKVFIILKLLHDETRATCLNKA